MLEALGCGSDHDEVTKVEGGTTYSDAQATIATTG